MSPGDLESGLRLWGCFCSCASWSGELTGQVPAGHRWQCCWWKAFSHENPVGVVRGCSSPWATPRYGLQCRSFLWLPVSCKLFEYPRPTGFFGACINSASSFKMQTWAWQSRLLHLPLLAEESRGRRSEQAERRCSPAGSQDAEEKHSHQFLNVSRDPLEIIYCVCCRI